jgi:hypothetical protein
MYRHNSKLEMYTADTRRLLSSNKDFKYVEMPYQKAIASCKLRLPNKKYRLNEAGDSRTIGNEVSAAKKNKPETRRNPSATRVSW